jgi:hypothetical protein
MTWGLFKNKLLDLYFAQNWICRMFWGIGLCGTWRRLMKIGGGGGGKGRAVKNCLMFGSNLKKSQTSWIWNFLILRCVGTGQCYQGKQWIWTEVFWDVIVCWLVMQIWYVSKHLKFSKTCCPACSTGIELLAWQSWQLLDAGSHLYACMLASAYSFPVAQQPKSGLGRLLSEVARSQSVRHTILGRTALDKWWVCCRGLYLTTQKHSQ